MANKNYQPGDNVEKDVKLYVKDSKGKYFRRNQRAGRQQSSPYKD